MITRRRFVCVSASMTALAMTGCKTTSKNTAAPAVNLALDNEWRGNYSARPNEKFPLPAVKLSRLPERYRRQRVPFQTAESPGSVIVETNSFHLFFVEEGGTAMRYGVGLGRQGFEWSGRARIAWKQEWPKWTPPQEMIAREPQLEKWSAKNGGMPPGLKNPLGARALYIFQGNVDTLYRIHGTYEPHTIGKAVSSGCVRMINQDVIDLYQRVKTGAQIAVTSRRSINPNTT